MKESTRKWILEFIEKKQPVRPVDIIDAAWLSEVRVHAILNYLLKENLITRFWSRPRVYYEIASKNDETVSFSRSEEQLLKEKYLYIDARWKRYSSVQWFMQWCKKWNHNPQKKIKDYLQIMEYTDSLRWTCWLINAYDWFSKKINDPQLDILLFLDIYQVMEFWKSKLASLAYYAKQSQSQALVKEVINLTKEKITCLQSENDFDAVCFIPRSIPRELQLMKELKRWWKIELPNVLLEKAMRDIIVPQKSLKNTKERILNARETILVWKNNWKYNHVLLIDDFVWSGWTMNESARKLRDAGIAKRITWLSLVWNIDMKYEVIKEI